MQILDHNCSSPEEHLAADEAALMLAESGRLGETVRLWSSGTYFIVLGRAGRVESECYRRRAGKDAIPVIRRLSGGGTVLQGPGSYNYSLVLSYDTHLHFRNIRSSYGNILGRIARELNRMLSGPEVRMLPLSDLALGDRKISGNAQARKKRFFLHHGTILFGMDIDRVARYIKHPPAEPLYRKKRPHADFITNIPLKRTCLERAVLEAFPPDEGERGFTKEEKRVIDRLVEEKYSSESWNLQF
jgi:lipoate-protein ligase A